MKKTSIISILLFLTLIPMLFHADYVTQGAKYGLLLWYNSVVPALFPFMVLSGVIVSQGGIESLMKPIYKVIHPVIPISGNACYVLISGLLCGYPMGAKTCADFLDEGQISIDEARFLMSICNHPSPMFLLGYVYPFFSAYVPISQLLVCVYLPVCILAYISMKRYLKRTASENLFTQKIEEAAPSSLDETIQSSVCILCKIGGYLVLFSILIVFLRHTSWIPDNIRLFLIGSLEMTTGIREMANSLSTKSALIGSIASLTFGGFSGIFQTKAVIRNTKKEAGLSIRPYIVWKLLHAGLSAGLAAILCNFS